MSASLAVMAAAAQAQNAWTGVTSSDWADGSNWSLGAPQTTDQVVVDAVSPNATVLSLTALTPVFLLDSLDIGSIAGAVGDVRLVITDPANPPPAIQNYTVLFGTSLAVGTGGGNGTLTFDLTASEPSVSVVTPTYSFGTGVGSLAQINVLGTGVTTAQQVLSGPTRSVILTSSWPADFDIVFGDQGGTAQVLVDGAGLSIRPASAGVVAFGRGAGSTGTLNVLNGGMGWFGFPNGNDVIFGDAGGTGTVIATGVGPDGTPSRLIFTGGATFGNGAGSMGRMNVLAGGTALSMSLQGPRPPQLGLSGGTGIATISGRDSAWNIIGEAVVSDLNNPLLSAVGNLYVGGTDGTGVLTLADGGTVALGQGAIVEVDNPDPTFPAVYYTLANFTPGLGTAFVGTASGSTGTVYFGAPAGEAPVAPGTLDAAAVELGGNGRIVFNHTDPGFQYAIPTSGTGTVQTLAGTTIFTTPGAVIHTGPTLIDGGILRAGAVDVLSPGSQHSVGPAGQLDLAGFNQTVADTTNAGLITLNPAPGATPGTTLTVVGNYVGQGGTIAFNTVLGSDGSPSDLLVIDGGSGTGDTRVRITNAGGLGALTVADGIRLVETQNGATTAGGAFRLDGRVAVGAYEYQLLRGGNPLSGGNANDGNWYLRNTVIVTDPQSGQPVAQVPNFRLEVPLYTAMPGLAHRLGFAALGTFHERTGAVFPTARQVAPAATPPLTRWCEDASRNFRCPVAPEEQSVHRDASPAAAAAVIAAPPVQDGMVHAGRAAWARVYGETGNHRPGSFQGGHGPSYDYGVAGVQAGMDVVRREDVGGSRDQLGFHVGYAQATADVGHVFGGDAGSITLDGYTIGGYWTHFGAQGWYVDAVAQVTRFDGTARSALGERLPTEGWGATLSLEGGYPIALGSSGWIVEPQAQLIYQRVSLDGGADRFGRVDFEDSNALLGRIGARVARSFTIGGDGAAAGQRLAVWGRANLWHAFGDDPETTFSSPTGGNPVSLSTSLGGTWAQVGLGVAGQVTEAVGLYASADYSFGLDSGGSSGWGGRGGLRIVW